jgi:hypothetical protein
MENTMTKQRRYSMHLTFEEFQKELKFWHATERSEAWPHFNDFPDILWHLMCNSFTEEDIMVKYDIDFSVDPHLLRVIYKVGRILYG